MTATAKQRPAWNERFSVPTVQDLFGVYEKPIVALLEQARERLSAFGGVREEVEWQGVWRWTLVYRAENQDRARAFIVPNPAKPLICVPVPLVVLGSLPMKRLSKLVREGLVHAPEVDAVRWAQWEVQSKSQLDEVMTLVRHCSPPEKGNA